MNPRFLGYGFAVLGVSIISPDSALIRKVGMDPAALLFWRGFGIFVVSASLSVLWYRGRLWSYFTESGVLGLLIALFFFISTCSFVYSAVTLNPIILLIFVALGPVSGAVFSIILLREPPRPSVWIAIGLSFLGMAVVVGGEMHSAGTIAQLRAGEQPNLPGPLSILALIFVPTLLGLGFTLARKLKQPNIWPSNALAGVMAMAIMPFIAPSLTVPSGIFWEFWFLIIFVSGFSFILITLAPRFISSAETSLVFLLETVIGSLWIWGLLGQRPEGHEIAGGAVVTLAVLVVVMTAARQKPVPPSKPRP
ncbi:MAG: hypothetical protein CMF26_07295 [Kiloniella sp.]|nr:hypothetical protein [Kiloniella sp.]RZO29613.1 MAG: DMT family transporter [Rhodospirillaceae bacterium]